MVTVKEITNEFENTQKEYEFFEERDAIDTADKKVVIKVKIDTATKESLERDKVHLQEMIDVIDSKLAVINAIK